MDREAYLDKIVSEFENWWIHDSHSSNMDFYIRTITYSYLASLMSLQMCQKPAMNFGTRLLTEITFIKNLGSQ